MKPLDGLGGVREGRAAGDGGDLESAPLATALPAVPLPKYRVDGTGRETSGCSIGTANYSCGVRSPLTASAPALASPPADPDGLSIFT